MINKLGIFWFRQDLRLNDNIALNELIQECKKIIPIFIIDGNDYLGSASKWWLENSLLKLNESLQEKNSRLYCFKGSPKKILFKLIEENKITHLHWNRLYDQYSIKRDSDIKEKLKIKKINIKTYKGSLINEPWKIKNKSGTFFKVFTPYWKTCLEEMSNLRLSNVPKKIDTLNIQNPEIILFKNLKLFPKNLKWIKSLSSNWIPGEKKALEIFNNFKKNIINYYDIGRDRPDKNLTSKLSPYLHFGEISPERIFNDVKKLNIPNENSKKKYLAEIGWREFSYNLLYYYPNIKTAPIQQKFKKFPWKKNTKNLKAWQEGKTGYPIIDAGMRQLYSTGWMHNRVRMIVGSFLCKNLLLHWWEGEKWFFDTLVDADFASNSAGWQWIAGCGADAAPYFRIFNPYLQSIKFDPEGEYIKKYIPEISYIPAKLIHAPWELSLDNQIKYKCIIGKDYPVPIVNLSISREKALKAFAQIKEIS